MNRIKKLLISIFCVVAVLFSCLYCAFAGYENFTVTRTYADGQFSDVEASDWFSENVKAAYEYGLLDGKSTGIYDPDGNLTIAETVKLASCLHSMYTKGTAQFEAYAEWYQPYVDYAIQNGIIASEPEDCNAIASRSQFAQIFAAALPEVALTKINEINDNTIPDVPSGADYENAVYALYRAGVLTGDSDSRFNPGSTIKRSEAAAIVTRMANPLLRRKVTVSNPEPVPMTSAAEVMSKCGPAVFRIRTYARVGNELGLGSGVLLSSDGTALTCAHVVNGCADAYAEFPNGSKYKIYIYDINSDYDLALVKLDGKGFGFLEKSTGVAAGDKIYAIGYPGGGEEKVTGGQVINSRNINRFLKPAIETDVPIYGGNSGGAFVDSYGKLIGIASRSENGGTPSFAVPVSEMDRLDSTRVVSMGQYFKEHQPVVSRCYAGLYPVPDFGKELDVACFFSTVKSGSYQFYYRIDALKKYDLDRVEAIYYQALNRNTFYLFEGNQCTSSAGYGYSVTISNKDCQGYPCFCVTVLVQAKAQLNGIQKSFGSELSDIAA